MKHVKCNFRDCLDRSGEYCTAQEIEIVNGKCRSISWSRNSMKSAVSPMERRHGSLINKPTQLR